MSYKPSASAFSFRGGWRLARPAAGWVWTVDLDAPPSVRPVPYGRTAVWIPPYSTYGSSLGTGNTELRSCGCVSYTDLTYTSRSIASSELVRSHHVVEVRRAAAAMEAPIAISPIKCKRLSLIEGQPHAEDVAHVQHTPLRLATRVEIAVAQRVAGEGARRAARRVGRGEHDRVVRW